MHFSKHKCSHLLAFFRLLLTGSDHKQTEIQRAKVQFCKLWHAETRKSCLALNWGEDRRQDRGKQATCHAFVSVLFVPSDASAQQACVLMASYSALEDSRELFKRMYQGPNSRGSCGA
jgi:hypothetical protein